ncbi:MAG: glycosyltransferase family 2 protein [Magnetococcales bacterium]|nr:glycosyltransferase family 2 protein [Magnetococcales bacterium]MBF0321338.1 glycosyltransferase family 2 protein [Magnetococcales bacterium]
MKTCILVPAWNCCHLLTPMVERLELKGAEDEIIVVDDASCDETFNVAASLPRVHVYRNEANLGYGGTSQRLYQLAMEHNADFTVNLHGDLGHPPENLPKVLERLHQGDVDIVIGSRLIFIQEMVEKEGWLKLLDAKARHNMPYNRLFGHMALTVMQNMILGTSLHSFHEGMRGCNRAAVKWILEHEFPSWYEYDMMLLIHAYKAGLRISEVGVPPNYIDNVHSSAPPIKYGMHTLKNTWKIRSSLNLDET